MFITVHNEGRFQTLTQHFMQRLLKGHADATFSDVGGRFEVSNKLWLE